MSLSRCCVQLALVPMLLGPALGCDPRKEGQAEYAPSASRVATMGNDTLGLAGAIRTPDSAPAQPPAPQVVEVRIENAPAWQVNGVAELSGIGQMTRARIRISGGAAGAHYAVRIRRGSCETGGAQVAEAPSVSADSIGIGSSEGRVDVPLPVLFRDAHVVVLASLGVEHACGPIPRSGGG
jgi:hypothetical protein